MSNLSDLLPSGAGGKQVDFVASGAIGNGKTVILNSNGTVTAVASVAASLGTAVNAFNGGEGLAVSMLTPTTFVGCGLNYGNPAECVIGTISNGAITFGSKVSTGTVNDPEVSQVQAITATQFVVIYRASGNVGRMVCATVSGNSISFGSHYVFESGQTGLMPQGVCAALNSTQGVISFEDSSDSSKAKAIIFTINASNAISFGSAVTFATPNSSKFPVVSALSSTKIVIAWSDTPTGPERGRAIIGNVSGTSISFGSAVTFDSPGIIRYAITALSETKFAIAYQYDKSASVKIGKAIVGDVSSSTITLGSPVTFTSANMNNTYPSVVKISESEFGITYMTPNVAAKSSLLLATVSGTSLTYDTPIVFSSVYTSEISYSTYSDTSGIVIGYETTSGTLPAVVYSLESTNLTATNFIGVTDAAIANSATGSVTIKGGTTTNLSSLTVNSVYYVQANGTISTVTTSPAVRIGRALSSTSINLEFTA